MESTARMAFALAMTESAGALSARLRLQQTDSRQHRVRYTPRDRGAHLSPPARTSAREGRRCSPCSSAFPSALRRSIARRSSRRRRDPCRRPEAAVARACSSRFAGGSAFRVEHRCPLRFATLCHRSRSRRASTSRASIRSDALSAESTGKARTRERRFDLRFRNGVEFPRRVLRLDALPKLIGGFDGELATVRRERRDEDVRRIRSGRTTALCGLCCAQGGSGQDREHEESRRPRPYGVRCIHGVTSRRGTQKAPSLAYHTTVRTGNARSASFRCSKSLIHRRKKNPPAAQSRQADSRCR